MSLSSPFTINKILQNVNLDKAQQRQIQDQQNVMQEKQEPTKTGFLNKALDLLSRGNYASANVALDLVNGGGFTPIKSAVDGFTGKSKTVYSDVLGEMGVENQWVKSGLGLVLDIGLDPTTYLGVGAAAKGGQVGLKFAGKVIPGTTKALSLLGDTTKFAGKIAGKSETLEKLGQWFGKSFIPNFRPMEVAEKDWSKLMKFKGQYDEALRLGQGEVYDNVFRYSRQYTQKERELIGNTMQKMTSGEKATAKEIDKELITLGLKDDKLRSVATEIRLGMNKMFTEETKRGIMETFKNGYMPGVYKKMSSTGRWSRPKVFDNFDAAKRAGYEPIEDASLLYGIRGVSSARTTATKDFFENLKSTFGTQIKEGEMLPGMERVRTPWLSGTAFPKEIAAHVDSMETFIGDKGVSGFLQSYDKALGVWKGTVTSLFPAFHIRNGISNVWNSYLAGMKNPARFYEAYQAQQLSRAIKLKDVATIERLSKTEIAKGITLADAGVGLITGLDFTGFGGGEKGVVKILAKTNDVEFIAKTLREIGVAEDLILDTAKTMSKISDEKKIAEALDKIAELQKTTKYVKPLAQEAGKLRPQDYATAEEFVKAQGKPLSDAEKKFFDELGIKADRGFTEAEKDTFTNLLKGKIFHGTNSGDNIIKGGFSGGSGWNGGVSFSDSFGTANQYRSMGRGKGTGSNILAVDAKNLKLKDIDTSTMQDIKQGTGGLSSFVKEAKNQGFDGLKDNGGEYLVWNTKKINENITPIKDLFNEVLSKRQTKSQLTDIWNQAKGAEVEPLAQEAGKYKSAEIVAKENNLTPHFTGIIKGQKFNEAKISIDDLMKTDPELKAYIEGGWSKNKYYPNIKSTTAKPIIGEWNGNDKVIDGFGRIQKTWADGEKYIDVNLSTKSQLTDFYTQATIERLSKTEIAKGITLADVVWQSKRTGVMNAGWMGKELSAEAVTQRGFRENIVSAVTENVGQKGTKKMIVEKANPLNALRTGREVGAMVENNSRLALFIDRVAKGDTFDEAAVAVKKYLFDYGELTNLEQKGMRRVVPFYTWMRKNIPLQVEQMVKQPGKFAGLEKVRNEIERASEDQKDPEKYLPDWMKNQYTIRMPWKNGAGDFAYLSPSVAFQDLSSGTSLNRWLSQISPFIKAPFEYAVNYDLFRRKQLADDNLPPDLKNWEKARAEVMNNLRIAGVFSRLSDSEKTLTEKILKETFGQPTYYYNLAQGKKTYKATKSREKSAEKKYKKAWSESTSKGIIATFRKFIQ